MQKLTLKAAGLYSDPNQLDLPDGALTTADNVVIDRAGIVQCRRGQVSHSTIASSKAVHRLAWWEAQSALVSNWDDGGGTFRVSYYSSGWNNSTASIKSNTSSDLYKMRFAEALKSLYFTTSTGVFRWDSTANQPLNAGMPKGMLDRENSTMVDDASLGPISPQKQRGYRCAWKFTDANGVVRVGAPSGRIVMANTNAAGGNNQKPTIRILLPKQVGTGSTALTTSYRYQLYASSNSADLSSEPPNDEALVYEDVLTSTNISNGYVDITDITGDNIRGLALYTNPSIEGSLQANEPPPFATEIAPWKDCLVYADTQTRARFFLQMIALPADGDTLSLGGQNYLAKTTPAASNHFKIDATTGYSTAQKIYATAQNLCAAVNRYSSNTSIWAFYVGDPDDARSLGKMMFEGRTFTDTIAASLSVGSGSKWEPVLSAGSQSDLQDTWANGLFFSKPQQPEAVPLLQSIRVGSQANHILKVMELGESLFVFKEREDGFRLTGNPPVAGGPGNFRVERIQTGHCLSPHCVQRLGDAIYALTTRGVVRITESSMEVVSGPIDKTLLDVEAAATLSVVRNYAFAVGYDTDRKYILCLPTRNTDTDCGVQLVFNEKTATWTRWLLTRKCGFVNPNDDLLYMSEKVSVAPCNVYQERKARASSDYQDPGGAAIAAVAAWVVATDPGVPKLFSEVEVMYGSGVPTTTNLVFTSELTGSSASIAVASASTNIARSGVPQEQRRCARLTVQASISQAQLNFDISGLRVSIEEEGSAGSL